MHAMHEVPVWVKLGPTIVMLIGLYVAWLAYIRKTDIPAHTAKAFESVHRFLLNKWYVDELYDMLFVRPAFAIRSEEHTSELQSLMRISYAVFCLKNKKQN